MAGTVAMVPWRCLCSTPRADVGATKSLRFPGSAAAWRRQPAAARALAPAPREQLTGDTLAKRVEQVFEDTFYGRMAAPRVLDSFRRLQVGEAFIKEWPGRGLQHAASYMEGLTAEPFSDPHSGAYPWLEAVEAHSAKIWEEFQEVTADVEGLAARGNSIWVAAVRDDALAYGPEWRTLVLQDRGTWEPTNSRLFPRTTKIFTDLQAPTLEVFFARQAPHTGIKSHTDYVNFVNTSHLGLSIPEGDCWIKVGEHKKKWEAGRVIVCDTSFMHETCNGTDHDRIVLIMRHWHPETTAIERHAAQFLFDCVDDPTPGGIKAAQRRAKGAVAGCGGGGGGGKKGKNSKAAVSSGGGGFGKKAA